MKGVDLYAWVRRAVYVEGMSQRGAARYFGIDPRTVAKMMRFSVPPGYRWRRPPARSKLDRFTGIIDQILDDDTSVPAKQRHTAKRIFERLRDEHGYGGGYTTVKDYVRVRRQQRREVFVPFLPQSDAGFVKAYPAETTEAFLDGHVSAFAFFGGVPRSILYDNTRLAVARVLGDGRRQRTRAFSELTSHYLFADRFGRPGKGNDKGKVENLVGYARRNYLVPLPRAASFEELNAQLEARCRRRFNDRLRGHDATIRARLAADQAAFLDLPAVPYEPCEKRPGRVSSLSLVRYRNNDYSVPTAYGHRAVMIRGYVDRVEIVCGSEQIACHRRSYAREDFVFDPLHYLALLEQKPGALDQAAPLAGWQLPDGFGVLRRLLEARLGKAGKREFVQVLRLLEAFRLEDVTAAVGAALVRGVIGFDAIKHLVLCRIERRPPRLDLTLYPYLPKAEVRTTSPHAYLSLLAGRVA